MKLIISKSLLRVLLPLVAVFIICLCCLATVLLLNPVPRQLISDILSGNVDSCRGKFFGEDQAGQDVWTARTRGLWNVYDTTVFDTPYRSVTELLHNYPWAGQYFFGSPGEPYCGLGFDPTYGIRMNWKQYTDNDRDTFEGSNIREALRGLSGPIEAYYNEDGFILVEKRQTQTGEYYYSRGYHGYYSVP